MRIVYAREPFPDIIEHSSIFLAGPTPRDAHVASWRPKALALLEACGYRGAVFVPEDRSGGLKADFNKQAQVDWERDGLERADCILFWVPRELTTMPAFTTNIEFGWWMQSRKIAYGAPDKAPRTGYLDLKAADYGFAKASTLEDTVASALRMIGDGAARKGGECQVPLHIWRTEAFQHWYRVLIAAGNRLDGAHVKWSSRMKQGGSIFLWVLHANVYVAKERRHKTNEVVVGRPDIAAVVLYRKVASLMETPVVLVREFRTPGAVEDGFVHELPGGSSEVPNPCPIDIACEEVFEETGLVIAPERLRFHGARQLAATMLSHKGHVFSCELTEGELGDFAAQAGTARGKAGDSERTYVEVATVRDILMQGLADWSNIGMVLSVLHDVYGEAS